MSKITKLIAFTAFLFVSGWIYVKYYQPEELKPVEPSGRVAEINMVSSKDAWKFIPEAIRFKEGETVLEEYSIAAGNMPEEIRLKVGDRVIINVFNEDSFDHGLAIEAFAINRRLFPNQSTLIDFIASKAGKFQFYCSVPCGEGHYQQIGTIIIEE
jgi:cytochrome c oxidase subunit 2